MATINWPGFNTGAVSFGLEYDVQMTIMRNGRVLTYGLPGARWLATISFENDIEGVTQQRPAIEAWLASLEGGANRASLFHLGRPRPNGTLTGTPTLASSAAGGDRTLSLTGCNGTLKAGDMIGLPGQIVMVLADATPVSTLMTVSVTPAIRAAHAGGTAVTWNKPTALFIPRSNIAGPFPYAANKFRPGFAVELVEAW